MANSCNPMDCSLPGSSVHEILQERRLEWVAISFSRGSSWAWNEPRSSALQADSLLTESPSMAVLICISLISSFEHFFMYFLAICISSLKKCLFRSSAIFFDCIFYLFLWYWASWAIHKFWRLIPCWLGSFVCQYFLPFSELSFCLWFPFLCKSFNFNFVAPVYFIFVTQAGGSIKIFLKFMSKNVLPVSLLEFYSTWPYI